MSLNRDNLTIIIMRGKCRNMKKNRNYYYELSIIYTDESVENKFQTFDIKSLYPLDTKEIQKAYIANMINEKYFPDGNNFSYSFKELTKEEFLKK